MYPGGGPPDSGVGSRRLASALSDEDQLWVFGQELLRLGQSVIFEKGLWRKSETRNAAKHYNSV